MTNRDDTGNERIFISGFKVIGISGSTRHLLSFKKLSNSVIEKVHIDGVAINPSCAGIWLYDSCKGNRISKCIIKTCDFGIFLRENCERNIIAENEITDHYTGIYIYGIVNNSVNHPCPYNVIAYNVCHDANVNAGESGDDGILVDHANYSVIKGNLCFNNKEHGIYVSCSAYCTVTGNVCYNNSYNGIQLNGSESAPVQYNTVTGNTCHHNGYQGTNYHGIYLGAYAKWNVVNSNTCYDNVAYGILEVDKQNYNAQENVIVGNSCWSNGVGSIALGDGTGSIKANNGE